MLEHLNVIMMDGKEVWCMALPFEQLPVGKEMPANI